MIPIEDGNICSPFLGKIVPKMCAKKLDVSGGVFFSFDFSLYFTGGNFNPHGRREYLFTFFGENCHKNVRKKIRRLGGGIFFDHFALYFTGGNFNPHGTLQLAFAFLAKIAQKK